MKKPTTPLVTAARNFHEVEKWTREGMKVDSLLYGGNSLERAREVFDTAIRHRPRIRLTIPAMSETPSGSVSVFIVDMMVRCGCGLWCVGARMGYNCRLCAGCDLIAGSGFYNARAILTGQTHGFPVREL
jgi:hypothetical protein